MDSNLIIGIIAALAVIVGIGIYVSKNKGSKPPVTQRPVAQAIKYEAPTQVDAPAAMQPQVETDQLDKPESTGQRSTRLKDRFDKSQNSLSSSFKALFSASEVNDDSWTELEDQLILADVGASTSVEIVENLKKSARGKSGADLKEVVKAELNKLVDAGFNRELNLPTKSAGPAVLLTVGVNGTGKTTTTGKLARFLVAQNKKVLLGAADTFRAAAAEQLATWGSRVGVEVVRGPEGGDPASVAFDAVQTGTSEKVDVVLIDTAGRLHTKQGLMDELGKVHRVASKNTSIDEVLLVIDATIGQNGLTQAKVFAEVVPVTGIVLTKLDGTAKGGIVIAVQQALQVPVKLVGLGEGPDDLAKFDPAEFVNGLVG